MNNLTPIKAALQGWNDLSSSLLGVNNNDIKQVILAQQAQQRLQLLLQYRRSQDQLHSIPINEASAEQILSERISLRSQSILAKQPDISISSFTHSRPSHYIEPSPENDLNSNEPKCLKSLQWLVRIIDDIYSARYKELCLVEQNANYPILSAHRHQRQQRHDEEISMESTTNHFALWVAQYLTKRFGLECLIKQASIDLVSCSRAYSYISTVVDTFKSFLASNTYDNDDLHFYLFCRSAVMEIPGTGVLLYQQSVTHEGTAQVLNRKLISIRKLGSIIKKVQLKYALNYQLLRVLLSHSNYITETENKISREGHIDMQGLLKALLLAYKQGKILTTSKSDISINNENWKNESNYLNDVMIKASPKKSSTLSDISNSKCDKIEATKPKHSSTDKRIKNSVSTNKNLENINLIEPQDSCDLDTLKSTMKCSHTIDDVDQHSTPNYPMKLQQMIPESNPPETGIFIGNVWYTNPVQLNPRNVPIAKPSPLSDEQKRGVLQQAFIEYMEGEQLDSHSLQQYSDTISSYQPSNKYFNDDESFKKEASLRELIQNACTPEIREFIPPVMKTEISDDSREEVIKREREAALERERKEMARRQQREKERRESKESEEIRRQRNLELFEKAVEKEKELQRRESERWEEIQKSRNESIWKEDLNTKKDENESFTRTCSENKDVMDSDDEENESNAVTHSALLEIEVKELPSKTSNATPSSEVDIHENSGLLSRQRRGASVYCSGDESNIDQTFNQLRNVLQPSMIERQLNKSLNGDLSDDEHMDSGDSVLKELKKLRSQSHQEKLNDEFSDWDVCVPRRQNLDYITPDDSEDGATPSIEETLQRMRDVSRRCQGTFTALSTPSSTTPLVQEYDWEIMVTPDSKSRDEGSAPQDVLGKPTSHTSISYKGSRTLMDIANDDDF